jgi:hypothetical protein
VSLPRFNSEETDVQRHDPIDESRGMKGKQNEKERKNNRNGYLSIIIIYCTRKH